MKQLPTSTYDKEGPIYLRHIKRSILYLLGPSWRLGSCFQITVPPHEVKAPLFTLRLRKVLRKETHIARAASGHLFLGSAGRGDRSFAVRSFGFAALYIIDLILGGPLLLPPQSGPYTCSSIAAFFLTMAFFPVTLEQILARIFSFSLAVALPPSGVYILQPSFSRWENIIGIRRRVLYDLLLLLLSGLCICFRWCGLHPARREGCNSICLHFTPVTATPFLLPPFQCHHACAHAGSPNPNSDSLHQSRPFNMLSLRRRRRCALSETRSSSVNDRLSDPRLSLTKCSLTHTFHGLVM